MGGISLTVGVGSLGGPGRVATASASTVGTVSARSWDSCPALQSLPCPLLLEGPEGAAPQGPDPREAVGRRRPHSGRETQSLSPGAEGAEGAAEPPVN